MRFLAYLKPENGLPGRAFSAWLDHAPAGLASRFVVLWFLILYTAFAVISSASVGLHPDLLETYALGQHFAAGYPGHEPLAPWIVGAWFRLVPQIDWGFHLLTMVNAAAGLFAIDWIARQYLTGDKRIAALLLVLLMPFYQFVNPGFGAAATMLATWPLATWCFVRALKARGSSANLAWSAACGAAAALAVLGSYHSVFLIAGFAAAVLAHPDRRALAGSPSPWLAAATGALVLAPHAAFLLAMAQAGDAVLPAAPAVPEALWNALLYALESVAAAGLVLAVWWLAVRPDAKMLRQTFWPPDADGRTLVILLAVPLVLPALAAPFTGGSLAPSWTPSAWYLLPVILLRPEHAELTRKSAIRITALVALTTVGALATAPWLAARRHSEGTAEGREYYRAVANQVTEAWHTAIGRPLPTIMGDPQLAAATAFYSPDHPEPLSGFAPRESYVALCRADDQTCVDAARQQAAGKANTQFMTYSTINRYLGKPGRLGRFFFIIAPPGSLQPLNLPLPPARETPPAGDTPPAPPPPPAGDAPPP